MTTYGIQKNVIIFGAAMSCMEKSGRADIAFQLMLRMRLEQIQPNVHIFNSAISSCARTGGLLWNKGLELFKEMSGCNVVPDIVTYNAVLDATADQYESVAKDIFLEGLEKGFYSRVSRIGQDSKWLELDLHFLSLGGGEVGCRWWFEDCLVPYMQDDKLSNCKNIDIVTGYGRGRYRGVRAENDGMLKRIGTMLECMGIKTVEQANRGRIQIDVKHFLDLVHRNKRKIIFDKERYSNFKKTLNEAMIAASNVPQVERPDVPPIGLEKGGGVSSTGKEQASRANQSGFNQEPRRQMYQGNRYNENRNNNGYSQRYESRRSRSRSRDRNFYNGKNGYRHQNSNEKGDRNQTTTSSFDRSRFNPPPNGNQQRSTNGNYIPPSKRFVPRHQLKDTPQDTLSATRRTTWIPPGTR